MNAKTAFYKTIAFKCVVMVLSVLMICGVLLAVLSNVLEVSDQERANRAIAKIYGTDCTLEQQLDVIENYNKELGVIKTVYKISNGDYLILVSGKQGFSNGTITLWIAFKMQPEFSVFKVVYESNVGQSLISKISNIYDTYLNKQTLIDVINNNANNIQTGATYTSKASNNAVKVATEYVINNLGGVL